MTDATLLDATIDALAAHDGAGLFTVIDQVIDAGHDPRRFVTDLLERFRDLIVLHNVPNAADLGLIDAPEDQVAREIEQASLFGPAELTRAADVTSSALSELRGATAPRLHLELMAARLLLPASDADEAATRARLDQIERRMAAAPVHAPSAPSAAPASGVTCAGSCRGGTRSARPAQATVRGGTDHGGSVGSADHRRLPLPRHRPASPRAAAAPAAVPAPAPVDAPSAAAEPGVGLDQFVSMWPAVLDALSSPTRPGRVAAVRARRAPCPSRPARSPSRCPTSARSTTSRPAAMTSGCGRRSSTSCAPMCGSTSCLDPERAAAGARPATASASSRPAAKTPAPPPAEADAPSLDDDNADSAVGVDLALRELGATQIGEIDH